MAFGIFFPRCFLVTVFRRIAEFVAQAVDGLEDFGGITEIHFPAEAGDMDLERVGHGHDVVVPDIFQQRVAVEHLVFVAGQELQELVLLFAEPDGSAVAHHGMLFGMEREAGEA